MGAGASVSEAPNSCEEGIQSPQIEINLRKLPDAIEESLYVHEKWPLILDPTEQGNE